MHVTAEAKNPESCVTAGIANIPAPIYLYNKSHSWKNFNDILKIKNEMMNLATVLWNIYPQVIDCLKDRYSFSLRDTLKWLHKLLILYIKFLLYYKIKSIKWYDWPSLMTCRIRLKNCPITLEYFRKCCEQQYASVSMLNQ